MTNERRVKIGWLGDKTDLQQKLLETLNEDVMIYDVPKRPGEFTFVVMTEKSADELRKALDDGGIDDVYEVT